MGNKLKYYTYYCTARICGCAFPTGRAGLARCKNKKSKYDIFKNNKSNVNLFLSLNKTVIKVIYSLCNNSEQSLQRARKLNWKISKIVNLLVARTRREEKCQHLF